MENKIYTAEELRAKSVELVDILGEHNMTASMLRYAAEMVERCEKAMQKLLAMTDKNSPSWSLDGHAVALEDMEKINYILRGVAENDNENK